MKTLAVVSLITGILAALGGIVYLGIQMKKAEKPQSWMTWMIVMLVVLVVVFVINFVLVIPNF